MFADDFKDPTSGWSTETLPSGTTYAYSDHGYVVVAHGQLDHMAAVPHARARGQITASVTATQSTPAPEGAGFGVTCDRGTGTAELRYEFLVSVTNAWAVSLKEGDLSQSDTPAVALREGKLATSPGATPMTVEGTCATGADAHSTRLVLVVDGVQIVEFTDVADSLPTDGWYPELMVSSTDTPSRVTVTHYEVRTLPQ